MKKILLIVLSCILLTACSSGDDKFTTEYLTEKGQQAIENFKKNEADYVDLTELNDSTTEGLVKLTIVVEDVKVDEKNVEINMDYDNSNIKVDANFVRIVFPSISVDKEFKKGDTITVYGRYNGTVNENSYTYHSISGHFVEI